MEEVETDTTERTSYPPGAPCWVDLRESDLQSALAFYGGLFEWTFAGPRRSAGDSLDEYYVAQLRGRDVAGLGSLQALPGAPPPAWMTFVRVADITASAERAAMLGGSVATGPTEAQPAGRFAIVIDPGGAVVGLWEAHAREGAQLVNQAQTWALSTLVSDQPALSAPFYFGMFGWRAEPFGPPSVPSTLWHLPSYFGGTPGQPVARDVVALMTPFSSETPHIYAPCWSVDFWVDSVDATADRAEQLGGRVLVAPHDTPGFRSAFLADPAGAAFSVTQTLT